MCTPCRRTDARAGFSLAELLVALVITALLAMVLFGVLVAQLRLAQALALRAQGNDAVRTATAVLAGEAARATGRDVRAAATDSIALRAFRGVGVVCGASGGAVQIRYRGDRLPDPAKDSVLALDGGAGGAFALTAVEAGGCPVAGDETALRLRGSAALPDAGVLLVFEPGAYYLSSRALRYRLGAEGRQPLTAEAFRHPLTRFHVEPGADHLRFTLHVEAAAFTHRAAFSASAPVARSR